MVALTILKRYESRKLDEQYRHEFSMVVELYSSVLGLKEKIEEEFGYPREKQRMWCDDEELENHDTIEHKSPIFDFKKGANIDLLVEDEEVSVKVRCPILGNNTTLLKMGVEECVSDLENRIMGKIFNWWKLAIKSKLKVSMEYKPPMENTTPVLAIDENTIFECVITVELNMHEGGGERIAVLLSSENKSFFIKAVLDPNTKVGDLINKLEEQRGIFLIPQNYTLMHNGKQMGPETNFKSVEVGDIIFIED